MRVNACKRLCRGRRYRIRYYWDPNESDLLKQLVLRVARAEFAYGFE